jgi:predicted RNase H-like HicB family nuclease
MKFQVICIYDEEYLGYVADVPELSGCMSQGKTLDEAVTNVQDAIRGVLAATERNGQPYLQGNRAAFVGEIAV